MYIFNMSVRDKVSFEVPDQIEDLVSDKDLLERAVIDPIEKKRILQALEELYQTPEGRALIDSAAEHSSTGKIHILNGIGGNTMAVGQGDFPRMILLGDDDKARYFSPETGMFHDLSYQRLFYHEFYHIAREHKSVTGIVNLTLEEETVRATNKFMSKYYSEPARDPDNYFKTDNIGTPGFDLSDAFRRKGYSEEASPLPPPAATQQTPAAKSELLPR